MSSKTMNRQISITVTISQADEDIIKNKTLQRYTNVGHINGMNIDEYIAFAFELCLNDMIAGEVNHDFNYGKSKVQANGHRYFGSN